MRKSFDLVPFGVVMIVPDILKLFHDPVDSMIGVFPLGAHVVRTTGRSEMPDSS